MTSRRSLKLDSCHERSAARQLLGTWTNSQPQQDAEEPKNLRERTGTKSMEGGLTAASPVHRRSSRVLSFPAPPSVTLTCRNGNTYDYLRDSSVCVKVVVTEKGVMF